MRIKIQYWKQIEEIRNNIEEILNFRLYAVVMNDSLHVNNTAQFSVFVRAINMELDKAASLSTLTRKESLQELIQDCMKKPRRCCKA
jgi:hypothetical protein